MDYVNYYILINFILSFTSYFVSNQLIPLFIPQFLQAKRFGIDVHKKNKPVM